MWSRRALHPDVLSRGVNSSSGSSDFDQLRSTIASDPQLRYEIEALFRLVVETYNPSDRGVRFITGGITEWILAMASYASGIVTLPDGHNSDRTDLRGVLDQSRELWSVKGSNSRGGTFTISNGQGGAGAGLTSPTIFWSPEFRGMVFVDPNVHTEVVGSQVQRADATVLSKRAVAEHAVNHPECVIELQIPDNPGTARLDPSFEAVKLLIGGHSFPRLRRLLSDTDRSDSTIVEQLRELQSMKEHGLLSDDAYHAAVRKLTET